MTGAGPGGRDLLLPAGEAPPVGALVDVALSRRPGAALTARLLDVGPDRLVLAPPSDVLDVRAPLVAGERTELVWSEHGAVVGVVVRVEDVRDEEWDAAVVARPHRVQRRDAVRVAADLRAHLSPLPEEPWGPASPPAEVEVPVADLSESGARCVVDPLVLRLEDRAVVLVRLPLDGLSGPLGARVVHRRFRGGSRAVLVGLRFEGLAEADADVLRRHVFGRQRELRRRGAI